MRLFRDIYALKSNYMKPRGVGTTEIMVYDGKSFI